jgi:hypothetical protein
MFGAAITAAAHKIVIESTHKRPDIFLILDTSSFLILSRLLKCTELYHIDFGLFNEDAGPNPS